MLVQLNNIDSVDKVVEAIEYVLSRANQHRRVLEKLKYEIKDAATREYGRVANVMELAKKSSEYTPEFEDAEDNYNRPATYLFTEDALKAFINRLNHPEIG